MPKERGGACPPDRLNPVVSGGAGPGAMARLEGLLADYPADPRLHFLRGSWLAAGGDYGLARLAIAQALSLAPNYVLARFQLGLLELSSGEPAAAVATWRPLEALPDTDALRAFAQGLKHLIADQFDEAIARLEDGIALNRDNPSMNADMRLIIERIRARDGATSDKEPISASHLLLRKFTDPATRH